MSDTLERLSKALEGHYSIEREIGAGGMATVYLAQDLKHNRNVAVKVLKPELAAVLGGERFLTEITTTAKLQHPHILPLFDSGEADSFLYYVMPYVEGETLRGRLDREHQLPVKEAVALAEAVASALDYAHRHDVIHRDIKPENILLHEGSPVVADFGIALAVSAAGGGRMTETGLSLGTPHYMSPEQATADRDLTARSDVYSLACVLYEMLTGDPPHTGPTPQSILMRILTEEPRSVTDVRKSVPRNVACALTRALEKLPADRFESAGEFARALGDKAFTYVTTAAAPAPAGAGQPGSSGTEAPHTGPWLADVRSKVAVGALVGALVLLGVMLGANGNAPEGLRAPVTRFEVDLGELEVPSQIAISPDGTTLVFASRTPGGLSQLYTRRADEIAVQVIPGTEQASDPIFSPDGDWIAYVVNGVELRRIPAQGGASLTITTLLPAISSPTWGADGSILFAGPQGLYRVPFGGGEVTHILATPLFSAHSPKHLPDGSGVLFTHQPTNNSVPEVRVLDLESGEVQSLVQGRDARYLDAGYLIYATPSGSMVAAPFDLGRHEITGAAIPIIDAVSTGPVPRGMHFTLAATGTAVYAVGRSNEIEETLVTVDLSGNESPIRGLPAGDFSSPRFDPTGRYLVFELGTALWIRDLVLGSQDQLAGEGSFNPVWSVDGSKLAFATTPPSGMATQILVRDAKLDSPATQLLESVNVIIPSAWTPDASHMVYTEFENFVSTGSEIWMVGTDPSSAPTPDPYLRADGWNDGWASLAPDGRWAAYESNADGRNAIYVRAFPDPGVEIKVSEGGGIGARWSADGKRIFYRNGDTTKVANVRTEPTFEVVSHETLFSGPYSGIDPHPDGTRVVAIKRGGSAENRATDRHLYFVVNWLDGVMARLGVER